MAKLTKEEQAKLDKEAAAREKARLEAQERADAEKARLLSEEEFNARGKKLYEEEMERRAEAARIQQAHDEAHMQRQYARWAEVDAAQPKLLPQEQEQGQGVKENPLFMKTEDYKSLQKDGGGYTEDKIKGSPNFKKMSKEKQKEHVKNLTVASMVRWPEGHTFSGSPEFLKVADEVKNDFRLMQELRQRAAKQQADAQMALQFDKNATPIAKIETQVKQAISSFKEVATQEIEAIKAGHTAYKDAKAGQPLSERDMDAHEREADDEADKQRTGQREAIEKQQKADKEQQATQQAKPEQQQGVAKPEDSQGGGGTPSDEEEAE